MCGVDVRGGAPGTRETDALDPVNSVAQVHGIVLAGGSAFGLEAAHGAVWFLEEKGAGFAAGPVRVPIVPSAILFDLGLGDPTIRPDAGAGYAAARAASGAPVEEGNVGAGAGATVGKLLGSSRAMRGGLGSASIRMEDGLIVAALVVVNAVGDVVDPESGRIVAGARSEDGTTIEGSMSALLAGKVSGRTPSAGENTTIGVIATNAGLTKAQATKVAQMAHDGLARTIAPSHTPWDGDTVFALSAGRFAPAAGVLAVGALAAEVLARAVLRGVRAAQTFAGYPATGDLPPR